MDRVTRRMKWSITALAFVTFAAVAATVSINASAFPYNQVAPAQEMSVYKMAELRVGGLVGLAGMYRITHGLASLPVGSRIKVTWGDGSAEEAAVTCLAGSNCVQPLPGTQKPPSDGGDGLGSGSGGGRGQGVGRGGGADIAAGSYGGSDGRKGVVTVRPGTPLPKLPKGRQEI
ncbi:MULTISPECIES: hypothetical protein [Stenotrophomonas]|uniref:hypothetical protein n=1 Tax=Stenotrophomonas TaxID=40323 RepID=UPI0026E55B38|nr:hypothetical protein [Stenotrophomonas sp. 704A1]